MHYLFKKDDGEIFSCTEKHANIYYGDLDYLGAVDDSTINKLQRDAYEGEDELEKKLDELYRREEKIQDNREKLLTEEFLPEDHEKVRRAEKRIEEVQEKIREISDKLSDVREDSRDKVIQEAVKQADKEITPPDRDYRAVTKDGQTVVGKEEYKKATSRGL